MQSKEIHTTNYFMIGWNAYFADSVWDFMVLRDRSPYEVYYREFQMPGFYMPDLPNTFTIAEKPGWIKMAIDSPKLKNYMERKAKPETWKQVSNKFRETHQVQSICDGASLSIEFTKPNGKIKELHYFMNEFPEEWHPSYQNACRLLRYLEKRSGTAKKNFACFIGG